jgi:DNA polymerase-3 subunit alpha
VPDVPEWSDAQRMAWERELIGYYATDHPLAQHERVLRLLASTTATALAEMDERTPIRLGGMIRAPRTSVVKSGRNEGRRMAFFQLEDFAGLAECVVFSRPYAELSHLITPDRIVFVEGRLDRSREEPSVQVDRIVPVEEAPREMAQGVLVRLQEVEPEALRRLHATVADRPGGLPLVIEFRPEPDTVARVKAGPTWSVAASDDLLGRLAALPDVEGAEYLAREP